MRQTVLAFLLLSARGGIAALAAWAICKLLRRAHAPGRLLCWLWLAVGLRFVLPWGIPLRLPRPQSAPVAAAADTVQELGTLPLVLSPAPSAVAAAPLPWYARLTPWHAVAAVWAVGVLVLAVRGAAGYIRLKRRVALACKTPDGCYSGACLELPFTLGVLRPRIYLPDTLQGAARQAVLLHEQTHIRRRDTLVKPLFYAVACLHWFNPLAWLAFREFERNMEAACDEAAVRGCTLPQRNAYCETLLQFAMQGRSVPGSLAFGAGGAKTRIVHLLHYRRLGAGALALCVAAVGLCATACMVRPQVDTAPATPEAAEPAAEPVETPAPSPTAQPTGATAVAAVLPTLHDAANSPRFLCPVEYKYISRFATDGYHRDGYHRGDDLCAAAGTEIHAAADGVVLAAQEHYSWGNFVEIDHGTDSDGLRWTTLYAHMQSYTVQEGQTVRAGDVIGYVGDTGNTTGNACHFEMSVGGVLLQPRYFTDYGADSAELTQEMADRILAEAAGSVASSDVQTDTATEQQAAALAQQLAEIAQKRQDVAASDLSAEEKAAANAALDSAAANLQAALRPAVVATATGISRGYSDDHPGLDIAADEGTPVYAFAAGTVREAGYSEEKGNYIVLTHADGLESEYRHLQSLSVDVGQAVNAGQEIGYVGSTGNSTGPHLHFELRENGTPVDPSALVG